MCHRVICHDCGKYTWEGCGLHIAQALAGLSLEQICSCDDDHDSEHSWATITSPTSKRFIPRYPLPYQTSSDQAGASSSATGATTSTSCDTVHSPSEPCPNPSPVEYKLSKISTTSAAEAAMRKAQQAAALEELRRRKEQKEKEIKTTNQDALERLLQGLSQVTENTADEVNPES
ncbi:hypothetical protein BC939DRAFT_457247 [Gamsiella multidivaricata]|uniref:uncharacterized protein n=1 Tax=Gamsiella multidivaricata TaxID=101098 RepID=UPI002220D444|nr:uncharacterized protein BC939DRAFT_457247 [Gamsiella multidivaricata]KAI7820647.1 hypothetical protein BC939DRAFT_457247 [Gamsiella multidivaricata]